MANAYAKGYNMEEQINPVNAGQESVEAIEVSSPVDTGTQETAEPSEPTVQSKEENSKYAAARREAEAEKRALEDKLKRLESTVTKAGYQSVDEYAEALERHMEEQERERKRDELESQGIDPDVYEQLISNDPRIQAYQQIELEKQTQAERTKALDDFLTYFSESNGRQFDANVDKISIEVEQMWKSGVPLVVAYKAVEEPNTLRKQLADMKLEIEAIKTNKKNSESSTGSLSTDGRQSADFISYDVFEQNRSNKDWVKKNLDTITKSRKQW